MEISLNLYSLPPLLSAACTLFLGFLIFWKSPKEKLNRVFFYFSIATTAWLGGTSILIMSCSNSSLALIWDKFVYLAVIFIPPTCLHFSSLFTGRSKKQRPLIALSYITAFFFALTLYNNSFVEGMTYYSWGCHTQAKFFHHIFLFNFALFISFVFYNLISALKHQKGIQKIQTRFILVAFVVLGFGVLGFLPAYGINFYPITYLCGLIAVVIIAYAIAKHHLLNVKVITTELFAALIPLMLLLDAFLSESTLETLLKFGLFVFTSIFSILLVRSVIQEVKSKERMEKMAESLHQANIELQRLDKAKSEFISIASHQLRTPLTAIRGFISMILEGDYGKIDGTVRDKLEKTMQSAQRLVTLVEDLLTLSRIEGGKLKYNWTQVNFSNLVKSVFEELEPQARLKKIEYRIEIEDQNIILLGDENKLRQVIMNLIDNAIKYTLKGSVVCSLERESGQAIFRVKDTGIGIDKSDIHFLFAKFSRGDRSPKLWTEGLGLGLYVARIMLQQHQGTIGADSQGAGQGSTFWVKIPVLNRVQNNSELRIPNTE